jgi:hypothetical protein
MVPEWKIRVEDENGNPYAGKMVRQFCTNYTLGIHPCEDADDTTKYTDDNGYVVFPERKIQASLLSRLLRSSYHFVLQFAHGGFGAQAYVDSSGPQGYKRLDYDFSQAPPEVLILPSEGP